MMFNIGGRQCGKTFPQLKRMREVVDGFEKKSSTGHREVKTMNGKQRPCIMPWYIADKCQANVLGECNYIKYPECGAEEDKQHADMEDFGPERLER